jgi:hypothetical protein
MNNRGYNGEAPSLKDLITRLSGIHVTDRDKERAVYVAGHLIKFILGDKWDMLSEGQRKLLVKPSSDRLWDNYMQKRKNLGRSTKQDAKETIEDEIKILKNYLIPKKQTR